jgi:ParB family chromosome partitioning protein
MHGGQHPLDQALVEIYQQQTQEHRLLQRKADRTQAALKASRKIFEELFADPEFVSLLRNEGKGTAPRYLVDGVFDVEMAQ